MTGGRDIIAATENQREKNIDNEEGTGIEKGLVVIVNATMLLDLW